MKILFLAEKYVPYGEKTKEELITLVYKITDYFIKNHNIKMMVVACNTATCGAIEEFTVNILFLLSALFSIKTRR